MKTRLGHCLLVFFILSGCTSIERLALPDAKLADTAWAKAAETPVAGISHEVWQEWLTRYVKTDQAGVNLVLYREVTERDEARLNQYIAYLESVRVSALSRDQQLAFWINLYNAKTVALVLENWPITSIREVKLGGVFAVGPWGAPLLEVEGRMLSLNDVEHGIVRPVFEDNRIHYALNCAAYSCPNLQRTAYTAANLEMMLEMAAKAYVNDPRGVTIDG
ncbi:MAG: DUF547 domain-containing protein, partial [Pseudomonadota bacterium]